jgi:hypothetical protein
MAKKQSAFVEIQPIKTRRIILNLVGTSPLIMNRFSRKAWEQLLYPSGRMNKSERETSMKHNPLDEYRGALYRNRESKTPTLFHIPNGAVKGALASAALDIPGATRASIERLTSVMSPNINLYGIPEIYMAMVRNSDMNRTPDVRTRPIFPQWACTVEIEYKTDPLNDNQIINLLAAAGIIVGLGDWRPQKGGDFGKFRIANATDKELKEIVAKQGRAPQAKAYEKPCEYDEDTAELLAWFEAEVARRRQSDDQAPQPQAATNGSEAVQ